MDEINNLNNTQLPQTPEENKPHRVAYVVLVLLVVIGGAAVYFNWFYKQPAPATIKPEATKQTANNTNSSTPSTLPPAQQLDLEKRTLLASGAIKLNPTTQSVPITIDKLPAVLKKFVDQSGSDLKIEQVQYEGGLTGYEISYVLKDIKMQDVSRRFQLTALNNKFEMLKGLRAERFGFAEYESAEYKIRVSYTLNEDDTVKVSINIINFQ